MSLALERTQMQNTTGRPKVETTGSHTTNRIGKRLRKLIYPFTKPAVCQPLDIKMVFLWHLLLQIQVFLTGVTSSVTVADKIK